MKILLSSTEIEKEIIAAIVRYSKFYWAVAWAGVGSKAFEELKKHRTKINTLVIGTHFFQTHPKFIEEFMDDENVRFKKQTSGVFHPKLYFFANSKKDWLLISGSANFTKSAFNDNCEVATLISSEDVNEASVYEQMVAFVDANWENAEPFTTDLLETYSDFWVRQQSKLKSLSGTYGSQDTVSVTPKSVFDSAIIKLKWQDFFSDIKTYTSLDDIKERIELLKKSNEFFSKYGQFNQIPDLERKLIGGFIDKKHYDINWRYFGSMKGSGLFKQAVNDNNAHISKALDKIPLYGQITKNDYDASVAEFQLAIPKFKNPLGIFSRLLAMKRPDVFVCVDSKNKANLSADFGIKPSNLTYETYWEDVILRIMDSNWYNSPQPKNGLEKSIHLFRSAFLDCLYYED